MLVIGCLLLLFAYATSLLITYMLNFREDKLKDMLRSRRLAGKISASVMLLDQDVLECPICCEPLKIPIYRVIDGIVVLTAVMDLMVTKNKRLARKTSARASVALLDQDVLECPICCEPLKIPTFQCINGHLACTPCWKKVKNICPSCQKHVRYEFRCRAMEKVIDAAKVPCPNAGCKENISYTNLSSHEEQCVFAQFYCPIRDCNYTCLPKDLYKHVRANHRDALRGL